jgi:hypothetical protein
MLLHGPSTAYKISVAKVSAGRYYENIKTLCDGDPF